MPELFQIQFPFPYQFPALVFAVLNKYPNSLAPHVISIDVLNRTILEDGTIRSERVLGVQQDSPKWVNRLLGSQDVTYVREISFLVPSNLPNKIFPASPPIPPAAEPPKLLMASTNLTLAYLLQCRESISYTPLPWPHLPSTPTSPPLSTKSLPPNSISHPLNNPAFPPHTLFSQSAIIFSTGLFASSAYPPRGTNLLSVPLEKIGEFPAATTALQRLGGRRVEKWSLERFVGNAVGGRGALLESAGREWIW